MLQSLELGPDDMTALGFQRMLVLMKFEKFHILHF